MQMVRTWPRMGLALAIGLAILAGQAIAQQRVEVPISQTVQSNGKVRYSIPVTVGGQPMEAMLDTGSFGLRVLARALPSGSYQPVTEPRRYRFGSGSLFNGSLARTTVAIGGASISQPIAIQVVDSVVCGEMKPDCPAARVSQDDYRISSTGRPGEGYVALIGTSLRKAAGVTFGADNPLGYLGNNWIIVLPDGGSPGRLVINPDASEIGSFKRVKLSRQQGSGGWQDTKVNGKRLDSGADDPRAIAPFRAHAVYFDQNRGEIGFGPRN